MIRASVLSAKYALGINIEYSLWRMTRFIIINNSNKNNKVEKIFNE